MSGLINPLLKQEYTGDHKGKHSRQETNRRVLCSVHPNLASIGLQQARYVRHEADSTQDYRGQVRPSHVGR